MGVEIQSLDLGREFGEIPQATAPKIFTAIAIFLRDDVNTYNYFKNFPNEIDEMTGPSVTVFLADPVDKGDAHAVARAFDPNTSEGKRFHNLRRGDLPCLWLEGEDGGTSILRISDDLNNTKQILRAMADVAGASTSASDLKARVEEELRRDLRRNPFYAWLFNVSETFPMFNLPNDKVAIGSGLVFIVTMLAIALFVPQPSPFQYFVFRSVLAVAAAAFATAIPGILDLKMGNWLKASGALAVLVLVFLVNPASLVVK